MRYVKNFQNIISGRKDTDIRNMNNQCNRSQYYALYRDIFEEQFKRNIANFVDCCLLLAVQNNMSHFVLSDNHQNNQGQNDSIKFKANAIVNAANDELKHIRLNV